MSNNCETTNSTLLAEVPSEAKADPTESDLSLKGNPVMRYLY
jgi:hypothetical protein